MIDSFSILASTLLCMFVILRAFRLDKAERLASRPPPDDAAAPWKPPFEAGG